MATYTVKKLNDNSEPIEVEADTVTITADGKVQFKVGDNCVAQFVNVDFYKSAD